MKWKDWKHAYSVAPADRESFVENAIEELGARPDVRTWFVHTGDSMVVVNREEGGFEVYDCLVRRKAMVTQ